MGSKARKFLKQFVLLIGAVALTEIGILYADELKPSKIYFVSGSHDHYKWEKYPYQPRSIFEILKIWGIQINGNLSNSLPPEFSKNDIFSAVWERWLSLKIGRQISRLKKKGYEVIFINKIEVDDLLKILASSDTLAVFHGGHSYHSEDFQPYELIYEGKGETYITVFNGGKPSALTDEVVDKAISQFNGRYRASLNLQLFFSSACYAGYCERGIREKLRLSDKTRFLSPRDAWNTARSAGATSFKEISTSFSSEISTWITELPIRACTRVLGAVGTGFRTTIKK
jgi:hypothetical protein